MEIVITKVEIHPVPKNGELKAFVNVHINDCLMIQGLKVVSGKSGTFVAMPSRMRKNGEWCEVVYPLDSKTNLLIQRVVLEEYVALVGEGG